MWQMIPMFASMGAQGMGQFQAMKSAEIGAKSTAAIEKMSRDYQTKIFEQGIEQQKPFYEAGEKAIPLYQKALGGEAEPTKTGLGAMEKRMVEKDTASMTDYVKNLAAKRLEATAGEQIKGRLMDVMQIGLGQAGSAGRSAVNLGANLASSMQRSGGALASAAMAGSQGRQNIFTSALDNLSGLPAYMASRQTTPAPQPRISYVGGIQRTGSVQYA